ncbi:dihydrodipicolinate synthase family protein [Occallatibacter riparius]|uniref:Dihydrodipicolinate synthase family protein n=1 Tax=Occallatibacter riparius TaxID=1002689 RepID=A0A9J7BJI8_9BACT|nr:dihydrodipicolinate synthase family protein [Occallatibacter riparius]UWZ83068.1 dihydrodipicolinate synthase family protein [Occallatibacter riparius]
MLLEGIFAAAPTPFYSDERVYFRKIEHNMARYSRSLLSGMVVLGSTGEAVELTDAESREVLRVAAEATAPEKVLIAGVGRESVRATVELAEAAAEAEYDAVLVRTPTYYAPLMTTAAVLHYYRSVADRSPLPVILYHIPKFVPYPFPVEVIAELAHHPNIIGTKDSTGSVDRIKALVEATKNAPKRTVPVTTVFEAVTGRMMKPKTEAAGGFVPATELGGGVAVAVAPPAPQIKTRTKEVGFQVLTGSPSSLLESLEAGANGSVLGFAACAPQACQEIYLAWKDHDKPLAAEKQKRIAGPSQRIAGALGIPGIKYGCDFNGYYGGRARSPLLPLTADEKAEVERLLAEIRN